MQQKPKRLFISYAHEDENHLKDFQTHLVALKRSGLISDWTDYDIAAGADWDRTIKFELDSADVIIFLLSPDFIASDYINDVEIQLSIEKNAREHTAIVPIIIRPCDFGSMSISKFQVLPRGAKPISLAQDRDAAWLEVIVELKNILEFGDHKSVVAGNPKIDSRLSSPRRAQGILKYLFIGFFILVFGFIMFGFVSMLFAEKSLEKGEEEWRQEMELRNKDFDRKAKQKQDSFLNNIKSINNKK